MKRIYDRRRLSRVGRLLYSHNYGLLTGRLFEASYQRWRRRDYQVHLRDFDFPYPRQM